MCGTGSGTGGRPRSSNVWKYFTYDKEAIKVCALSILRLKIVKIL